MTSNRHTPQLRLRERCRLLLPFVLVVLALVGPGQVAPAAAAPTPGPWSWGSDEYGQLGNGGTTTTPQANPVTISNLSGVTAMAGGAFHSLALLDTGRVKAWGNNEFGQLGDNTTMGRASEVTVGGPSFDRVVAIAAGEYHSVAVRSDGTVWAWGDNSYGQLGLDPATTFFAKNPVQVPGSGALGFVAKDVAAGNYHSLARLDDGTVKAWGSNGSGELGDGTTTDRHTPVTVLTSATPPVPLINIKDIAAGSHSMAINTNGTPLNLNDDKVYAWGPNSRGQLGQAPDHQAHPLAAPVGNLPDGSIDIVASAGGGHSLALNKSGKVWAWGANYSGQLGNGTTDANPLGHECLCNPTPAKVRVNASTELGSVTKIAAGYFHSLAVRDVSGTRTIRAWGQDSSGQIGNGGAISVSDYSAYAVEVIDAGANAALTGAQVVGAGHGHSLAA